MSGHVSRRALLGAGAALVGAVSTGCGSGAGPTTAATTTGVPAPSASSTASGDLGGQELTAQVLAAVGAVRTASVEARRAMNRQWTASGHVTYADDGSAAALVTVTSAGSPDVDFLLTDGTLYGRAASEKVWSRLQRIQTLPGDTQIFLSELLDSLLLLGPAGRVRGTTFTDISQPGRSAWSGSMTAAAWAKGLPPARQDWYQATSGMDVQLVLDGDGRPASRVDFLRPNSLEMTVETTWSDWGTPFELPSPTG